MITSKADEPTHVGLDHIYDHEHEQPLMTVTFELQDDGVHVVEDDHAPTEVISEKLVRQSAQAGLSTLGDGIWTIRCVNKTLSFGLTNYDSIKQSWIGVRADDA